MRRLAALFAALSLAVLAAMPASAVTGNYTKDYSHTYVGLIAFYDDQGEFVWRCSASLLSPTIILTAGHCTAEPAASARIWFHQDAGTQYDPATEYDAHTGYPDECLAGDPLCYESDELYNYGFNDFAGFPNNHDVGIVVLPGTGVPAATIGTYGVLADVGALDYLATNTRRAAPPLITVTGYGVSDIKPVTISYRERLTATAQILNTRNQYTAGYNIMVSANFGAGKGGTCFGDSGGPDLWYGTNIVLAVNSFVINGQCMGTGFDYRVDTQAVQDWIAEVTGEELPTAALP